MPRTRPAYPPEFRREAIPLMRSGWRPIKGLNLGVSETTTFRALYTRSSWELRSRLFSSSVAFAVSDSARLSLPPPRGGHTNGAAGFA